MRNYIEMEIFALKPNSFTHKKGEGTNFFFIMQGEAVGKNETPTIWFQGVSFDHTIKEKTKYLIKGYMQVRPPYNDRPAGLQVVVREAIELDESRYVVAKKRDSSYHDPVATANPSSETIPM